MEDHTFNLGLDEDSRSENSDSISVASGHDVAFLVTTELRRVWAEYFAWEQQYCINIIRSLASRASLTDASSEYLCENDALSELHATDLEAEAFTVLDFEVNAEPKLQVVSVSCFEILDYHPFPPYEGSTPINCVMFKGDDSDDLPFVPFAEESNFRTDDFMNVHGSLGWQDELNDVDRKRIFVEVARRLYRQHGVNPSDIDAMQLLPYPLCSTSSRWGLLWVDSQNDELKWIGSELRRPLPPHNDEAPPTDDLKGRTQSLMSHFCAQKNCIRPVCMSHEQKPKHIVVRDEDILANFKMVTPVTLCGIACYLHSQEVAKRPQPSSSEADITNLRTILSIAPESTVCDLAVICGRPCYRVRREIEQLRDSIRDSRQKRRMRKLPTRPIVETLFFDGHRFEKFTPVPSCDHLGPCNMTTECGCDAGRVHCEGNCRCDMTCPRRWKGCQCGSIADGGVMCTLERSCPCRMANRECEPELCVTCGFCEKPSGKGCTNAPLQREHFKQLEVRVSEFGWGVVLCEPAAKGDLVCEYIGELIYEPTFKSRALLADHRGRSYVFGLNRTFDVDASYAGNESRFINHSFDPNCVVRISFVNGDQRIGVYTSVDIPVGSM
ncbi:unnamed protein product [Somion occarium]|uniref:SET domain-containing protein n=1 Tax=Somion occarium TaxID=3059160 RepID=A0ABP1DP75_9APHY